MVHHRCDIPIGSLTLPCTNKTNELNSSLLIEGRWGRLVCLCFAFRLFAGLRWVNGRMFSYAWTVIYLFSDVHRPHVYSAKIFSWIESMLIFACTSCFMSRNTFMSKNGRKASHHCQINHENLYLHIVELIDIFLWICVYVQPYLLIIFPLTP